LFEDERNDSVGRISDILDVSRNEDVEIDVKADDEINGDENDDKIQQFLAVKFIVSKLLGK
jgi:hypothetical protein